MRTPAGHGAVEVRAGLEAPVHEHRLGRGGAPEGVPDHADPALVHGLPQAAGQFPVRAGEPVQDEPGVGDPRGEGLGDEPVLLPRRAGRWWHGAGRDPPVGELHERRVVGVVDGDDDVAVAGELLHQCGAGGAFDAETGRVEHDGAATGHGGRARVGMGDGQLDAGAGRVDDRGPRRRRPRRAREPADVAGRVPTWTISSRTTSSGTHGSGRDRSIRCSATVPMRCGPVGSGSSSRTVVAARGAGTSAATAAPGSATAVSAAASTRVCLIWTVFVVRVARRSATAHRFRCTVHTAPMTNVRRRRAVKSRSAPVPHPGCETDRLRKPRAAPINGPCR